MDTVTTQQFNTDAYAHIEHDVAPRTLARFLSKGKDYQDAFAYLGLKGQFSDINRKFQKLKNAVWDGRELTGEQPREIVEDMIGHCYLMLYLMDKEEEEQPQLFPSAGSIEGGAIMYEEQQEPFYTQNGHCPECHWATKNGHHMSCTKRSDR